jgi:hypothetical protein
MRRRLVSPKTRLALIAAALFALVLVPFAVGQNAKQKAKQKSSATKVVPQTETIRFPFREDQDPQTRSFTLEARPPLPKDLKARYEVAGDLIDEEGDAFPESQIRVKVKRADLGNVKVRVRLDPKDRVEVEPGEYTGTLTVAGKKIEPGAVTIDASIRDPKAKAIVWALLGFLIGLLVKIAGDFSRMKPGRIEQAVATTLMRSRTATTAVKREALERVAQGERYFKLRQYFLSGSFASSFLLGVLGAGSAYALAYLGNDSWGADDLDNWKVAAAAFAGVLTGVSGADLIKPFRPATPIENP